MTSKVDEIKRRLHTSSVPDSLPCREREYLDIFAFLESKLKEGVGGCMYISGVPGTGKTATVLEVIKALQKKTNQEVKKSISKKSKKSSTASFQPLKKFQFIEINGLKLSDPYQVYSVLYTNLTGFKMSSKKSCDWLEEYFVSQLKGENENMIVLMADELDLLCTKKQNILYHLFDWPNHFKSNLIVIAIANAMDLPERVMISRVSSRLGLTRLTFQPYNHSELFEIISSRISSFKNFFHEDAIQLVSRKVASVSGDARRALDICRRAVLIADRNLRLKEDNEKKITSSKSSKVSKTGSATKKRGRPSTKSSNNENQNVQELEIKVTVKDVHEALQEIFSSPKIQCIKNCSEQEQILLRAIVSEFRICGLEEAAFDRVYLHHVSQCTFDGIVSPSQEELFQLCCKLFDLRLILLDSSKIWSKKKIRLNVSTDDIDFALKSIN